MKSANAHRDTKLRKKAFIYKTMKKGVQILTLNKVLCQWDP